MNNPQLKSILEFAITTMQSVKELTIRLKQEAFSVEAKNDGSFVSTVEKAIESHLRLSISSKYPDHRILGEEFGFGDGSLDKSSLNDDETSRFVWTIDPIDGTRNFLAGLPTPPILLGLLYAGEPVLGVVCHPFMDLTIAGAIDCGVFVNNTPYKSTSGSCPEPILFTGSRGMFKRTNEEMLFDAIHQRYPDAQVYLDAFSQCQSVIGNVDAVVEWNLKVWDYTPLAALSRAVGNEYVVVRYTQRNDLPDLYCSVMGKPAVVSELVGLVCRMME
jgi:inositol-phosphate phosphatase / L-galactose 1-phosphate phosphatase / histidinol-phosphatase